MASLPQNLCVPPGTSIRLTLEAITKNGRQVALVTAPDDHLLGIVNDGDMHKARCCAERPSTRQRATT